MEKFFQTLSKPAKWVLIIGGFFYAVWFAVMQGSGIDGQFVSVLTNLIVMAVGIALLAATPILVLVKKDDIAKMVFLFLVGYWVLTTIQSWFFYAETFTESNDGLAVTAGIFSLIAGLGLVAILVLTILEFFLKKPALRLISLIVMLGVIAIGFIAGLLLTIYAGKMNAFWPRGAQFLVDYMILPLVICFGYLYFFGAPSKKK